MHTVSTTDEPVSTLRKTNPNRRPISGYKQGHTVIMTYFDLADRKWVFEHWEQKRLLDRQTASNGDDLEFHFQKTVKRVLDHRFTNKAPYVRKDYVPAGGVKGIKVWDPAKVRGRRSIIP